MGLPLSQHNWRGLTKPPVSNGTLYLLREGQVERAITGHPEELIELYRKKRKQKEGRI